jgi:hypothetical protein
MYQFGNNQTLPLQSCIHTYICIYAQNQVIVTANNEAPFIPGIKYCGEPLKH